MVAVKASKATVVTEPKDETIESTVEEAVTPESLAPMPDETIEQVIIPRVPSGKYENAPFPKTCEWLDSHGLNPDVVGIGGITKSGYQNTMGEDRNWPFNGAQVDELYAIYEAEFNEYDPNEVNE